MTNYLFIGLNRCLNFGYGLWVKWYLLFSFADYHHTDLAHMYVHRQYCSRILCQKIGFKPYHKNYVIGLYHGIKIDCDNEIMALLSL